MDLALSIIKASPTTRLVIVKLSMLISRPLVDR
jgi:hypothetical protein